MRPCPCSERHAQRRVVLTGGPGAGKTAVLELIQQSFCEHVRVLPESAGILFGGGFPRGRSPVMERAAQRAIYYTQRELEATAEDGNAAIVLCDRGTVDAAAYWPGPDEFWTAVGTTAQAELARYAAVIHLRTPRAGSGYNQRNPLRIESAAEAAELDERILGAWAGHSNRTTVYEAPTFLEKASRALEALRREMPPSCRAHVVPGITSPA